MTEFKITGPGEYRTRGGLKAIIDQHTEATQWPWSGIIVGNSGISECWDDFGSWSVDEDSMFDIIGPWVEPATGPEEATLHLSAVVKTLRDEMAIAAMESIIIAGGGNNLSIGPNKPNDNSRISVAAYCIADAMMAARQKGGAV